MVINLIEVKDLAPSGKQLGGIVDLVMAVLFGVGGAARSARSRTERSSTD